MSALTKIVLNRGTVGGYLKGAEIQAIMDAMGRRIASVAGEGIEVETTVGRTRARTIVRTATTDARIAEATDRNLTRAIDAGR